MVFKNAKTFKQIIAMALIILIMLGGAVNIYAATNDYRREQFTYPSGRDIIKPTARFEVINTRTSLSATSPAGEAITDPPLLYAFKGDRLEFKDLSAPGSGMDIEEWNFQINRPSGAEEIRSSVPSSQTLDEVGYWNFYLCIRDDVDPSFTNNWGNWSHNGNHRTVGDNPGGFQGYWYFTQVRVMVLPKPDFEIRYKGSDVTDSSIGTIKDAAFSLDFECVPVLEDPSAISQYKWEYWHITEGWKPFSTQSKPTLNITNHNVDETELFQGGIDIRLTVTTTEGIVLDPVGHHVEAEKFIPQGEPTPNFTRKNQVKPREDIEYKDVSIIPPGVMIRERRVNIADVDMNEMDVIRYHMPNEPAIEFDDTGRYYITLSLTDDTGKEYDITKTVLVTTGKEEEPEPDPDCEATPVLYAEWHRKDWGGLFGHREKAQAEGGKRDTLASAPYGTPVEFEGKAKVNSRFINRDDIEEWYWKVGGTSYASKHYSPPPAFIEYEDYYTYVSLMVKYNGKWSERALIVFSFKDLQPPTEPPNTSISVPYPFYPKEVDLPDNKRVTWDYDSPDHIPYKKSIVTLKKKIAADQFQTIFANKTQTQRELVIEGDANDEYVIEVVVVDEKGNKSKPKSRTIYVMDASPVIDLALDTSIGDVLRIDVENLTDAEIEKLFPTSYTDWKIEDMDGNLIVEGQGETPKSVTLDQRFKSGEHRVTQNAINTLGNTATASKIFDVYSVLDFDVTPWQLFETELATITDLCKDVSNKKWEIRRDSEPTFTPLTLDHNNQFTRDYGRYTIILTGEGYFRGGNQESTVRWVHFLNAKPRAAFIAGGTKKMYKKIYLDGTVSRDATDTYLQKKYPILFSDLRTRFVVEPLTSQHGVVDLSKNGYVLGEGKEIIDGKVTFRGKYYQNIRIDKEGWYRIKYKVTNAIKESDWAEQTLYVSPELGITTDINVAQPVVYRNTDNALKSRLDITVQCSSPDDEIDWDQSRLLIYYDHNNDGNFQNDGRHTGQWITQNAQQLQHYISRVDKQYTGLKATFTLYVDNPDKNVFGKFKFEFEAVEKPSIPNYTVLGPAPLITADTFNLDDAKKIILIDNQKPAIHVETRKSNTVEIWIMEEAEHSYIDVDGLLERLKINRIKAVVYRVKRDGTVEIIEQ